jgi:hypothetical protein
VVHALALVALLALGSWVAAALVSVSAVWTGVPLNAWVKDGRSRLIEVLIAAIPDVLSVGAIVWTLLQK